MSISKIFHRAYCPHSGRSMDATMFSPDLQRSAKRHSMSTYMLDCSCLIEIGINVSAKHLIQSALPGADMFKQKYKYLCDRARGGMFSLLKSIRNVIPLPPSACFTYSSYWLKVIG